MSTLSIFISSTVIFAILDLAWSLIIANNVYPIFFNTKTAKNKDVLSIVLLYIIIGLGLTFIVILPGLAIDMYVRAGIFGLVVYGVHNISNYATIPGWPKMVMLLEIFWGIVVTLLTIWIMNSFLF